MNCVLYSSIDGVLNKTVELIIIIEKDQPIIIALSEIKPKRQYDFNIAEYNIPGYTLFVNNKIKRGVAIYAHVSLSAQLFKTISNSCLEESVLCQLVPSMTQRFHWDVLTKVPMQLNKMRKLYLVYWN